MRWWATRGWGGATPLGVLRGEGDVSSDFELEVGRSLLHPQVDPSDSEIKCARLRTSGKGLQDLRCATPRQPRAPRLLPRRGDPRRPALPAPAVVATAMGASVAVIVEMTGQIAVLAARLEVGFKQHPDGTVVGSLPGLGTVLGSRVLGEFGNEPLYATAKCRNNYAGTSPTTRALGTKKSATLWPWRRWKRVPARDASSIGLGAVYRGRPDRAVGLRRGNATSGLGGLAGESGRALPAVGSRRGLLGADSLLQNFRARGPPLTST